MVAFHLKLGATIGFCLDNEEFKRSTCSKKYIAIVIFAWIKTQCHLLVDFALFVLLEAVFRCVTFSTAWLQVEVDICYKLKEGRTPAEQECCIVRANLSSVC